MSKDKQIVCAIVLCGCGSVLVGLTPDAGDFLRGLVGGLLLYVGGLVAGWVSAGRTPLLTDKYHQ